MAIKQGGFSRKSKTSDEIPSSSLADIAFLLLIFFMVTTVFRTDSERDIIWPQAEATEKIDEKKKNILNIWVERNGSIFMNDQPYTIEQVSEVVGPLYAQSDRRLVISIRGDREVPYMTMDQLQKELVSAGVVRVVFATELEQRMTRQRR
ncbi:MAG: biopolymer transporter ExbD [Gemmatimonadales bacterium]|jgi:biopolymer transport protein ExbD|nr:MAG: biopolymer transporter ExbD [Gemmatimonadales bacterium]